MGGRVKHIGRGRYCLFLLKGFARTQLRRMSVNNVRAFLMSVGFYLYSAEKYTLVKIAGKRTAKARDRATSGK